MKRGKSKKLKKLAKNWRKYWQTRKKINEFDRQSLYSSLYSQQLARDFEF